MFHEMILCRGFNKRVDEWNGRFVLKLNLWVIIMSDILSFDLWNLGGNQ